MLIILLVVLLICAAVAAVYYDRSAQRDYVRMLSEYERTELARFCETGGTWRKFRNLKRVYMDD